MTMKLTVKRYNLRAQAPVAAQPLPRALPRRPAAAAADEALFEAPDDGFGPDAYPTTKANPPAAPAPPAADAASATDPVTGPEIDAIRREGLTGRQLRMARRMAHKYGLAATSDFDAVRLLRAAGHDPLKRSSVLELVSSDGQPPPPASRALTVPAGDGLQLPQTMKPLKVPATDVRAEQNHVADIQRIQQDITRRRRRKSALLVGRLLFFVFLPTLLAGWYYYMIATPLYATKTEFQIQQADAPGSAGMGGLLSGTQFATSQDSIAVQGYLQSRDAMLRLEADHGFKTHFRADTIDPIQRLAPEAGIEAAYKVYKRNVKIAYDPTEGIIKMEVIAADPDISVIFSKALISYAEEQVDQLTTRLRTDQMAGAGDAFAEAEEKMLAAQRRVVELQEKFKVLSSDVEVSLITAQIGQLESQLSADRLSLAQMEANEQPNQARMDPLIRRIATIESEIGLLRSRINEGQNGGESLAQVQSALLVAQADVQTRQMLLASSLQAMEVARIEANRQTRYLSVSVNPIAPDEATYPRAFENTAVAMLIFAGIYLMISMTAAILREQITA